MHMKVFAYGFYNTRFKPNVKKKSVNPYLINTPVSAVTFCYFFRFDFINNEICCSTVFEIRFS